MQNTQELNNSGLNTTLASNSSPFINLQSVPVDVLPTFNVSASESTNAPNFLANLADHNDGQVLTPCEPDRSASELNIQRISRSRVDEDHQQEAIEELDLSPISVIRQNSRMNA